MEYISTRGKVEVVSGAKAICDGIAPDGGLYVPRTIPRLQVEDIKWLLQADYPMRVAKILSMYLTDFSYNELLSYTKEAYDENKFDYFPAYVEQLNAYNDHEFMLELWHGPTAAFKDMALQLLPHLMVASAKKLNIKEDICILTATSGDTGSAALEGFKNIDHTKIIVFYPKDGISNMQRLQMVTQNGKNCHVIGIDGSFDDAQTGVKRLFADEMLKATLKKKNVRLSSANSINWGRLVAQIAYYVSLYVDLVKMEKLEAGMEFNVCVPTGNFGNILAAWYAMKMGIPIGKLVCASNRNKILSDFLRMGTYDKNRPFYTTNSPSMDILVSSNLERLLFEMTNRNSSKIEHWMKELKEKGIFSIDPIIKKKIQNKFVGGFCDDSATLKMIRGVYDDTDHVIDTHTAVAFNVYGRYQKRSQDERMVVYVSTASPYKFLSSVYVALFGPQRKNLTEIDLIEAIEKESDLPVPYGLKKVLERPILHDIQIKPNEMKALVEDIC